MSNSKANRCCWVVVGLMAGLAHGFLEPSEFEPMEVNDEIKEIAQQAIIQYNALIDYHIAVVVLEVVGAQRPIEPPPDMTHYKLHLTVTDSVCNRYVEESKMNLKDCPEKEVLRWRRPLYVYYRRESNGSPQFDFSERPH